MKRKWNNAALVFLISTLFIVLFLNGSYVLFLITYIFICLFMMVRTLFSATGLHMKIVLMTAYLMIVVAQIIFNTLIAFGEHASEAAFLFGKLFGTIIILLPFTIKQVFQLHRKSNLYMPSFQDFSVVTYAQLKHDKDKIQASVEKIRAMGQALTKENLNEVLSDLPRHSAFHYISNGSLTDEYFKLAYDSLRDEHVYIIVSNTGSAASELISVFTCKQYNHASLSFEADLQTIISYNGGEKVSPPGLNHEMIDFFNKKEDSSIMVYKLKVTVNEKRMMIDKVAEINREGSAYNLMGLVFKYSGKPNILFCSQFVYKMLQYAGIAYFEKEDTKVKPTDLIELDYYRKLKFAYEVRLNHK